MDTKVAEAFKSLTLSDFHHLITQFLLDARNEEDKEEKVIDLQQGSNHNTTYRIGRVDGLRWARKELKLWLGIEED